MRPVLTGRKVRIFHRLRTVGERVDAARNRARVLAAADELFQRRPPGQVTMEDIARAAGVGKGTLYRRYPSREAIAIALLDEHERRLQERMISGPPPLGPGAPPADRLVAFYAALVDLLERHGHLALAGETGPRRFTTGAYGFWRLHVRALLDEAGLPEREALTDVLLAPLAPELYRYQRDTVGLSQDQITSALTDLAGRALTGASSRATDRPAVG
jgi:AcrR family transcriptional regulator